MRNQVGLIILFEISWIVQIMRICAKIIKRKNMLTHKKLALIIASSHFLLYIGLVNDCVNCILHFEARGTWVLMQFKKKNWWLAGVDFIWLRKTWRVIRPKFENLLNERHPNRYFQHKFCRMCQVHFFFFWKHQRIRRKNLHFNASK